MKLAAGILPFCPKTKRFLLQKRGPKISNPNQWANWGGKAEKGESAKEAAIREFKEESGYTGNVKLISTGVPITNKTDGFTFVTYIGAVQNEFKPTTVGKKTVDGDVEVSGYKWVTGKEMINLIGSSVLHPGFNKYLKGIEMSLKPLLEKLDKKFNIEEDNVTSNIDGGLGQPKTPFSFTDKEDVDVDDFGWEKKVKESDYYFKKINELYNRTLQEISYNQFKSDDSKNYKQKINSNIIEIGRKLREVEQMIDHATKLKVETGADQTIFWKPTISKFNKINERLIRLSNKIREMNS